MSQARTDNEYLDEIPEWDSAITKQQIKDVESEFQNPAYGVNRRALLGILTLDSEKMFAMCEEDPECWFDAFRCTATSLGKMKALVEMLSKAHNRLMVALCGIDTDAPDAPFTKEQFLEAINDAKAEDANGVSTWDACVWKPKNLTKP